MEVRFTTRAVGDLESILGRLDEFGPDLPARFRSDFDAALERMTMFPHGAPPVDGFPGLRRARVRRSPYGVFYRPGEEELLVVRILHAKQDRASALA